MKKSPLFLCLACLISNQAVKAQAPVTFGITAGSNFSYLYHLTPGSKSIGKAGANVDLIVRIGNRLYFEPDLCFNLLRSRLVSDAAMHEISFATLQLPLLIGYQLISKPRFNLRVALGPEAEINLKKPRDFTDGSYKSLTSGGRIMAGADIKRLIIDVSFSSVFDKLDKQTDQKMATFSLGIGYKF